MFDSKELSVLTDQEGFKNAAIALFHDQYNHNPVYREYTILIGTNPDAVTSIKDIPFLPIDLFKSHQVIRTGMKPEKIFESSGTTGNATSKHFVADLSLYRWSMRKAFELFFDAPQEYCILALLPSYLERDNSSLVFMVNQLMEWSGHPSNGFFLDDLATLATILEQLNARKQKTILFGVSFALLELAANYNLTLPNTTIIETGGMKGKRKEITREELYATLKSTLKVNKICSEYGMTELLSQAYADEMGTFNCPPWMRVMIRDTQDPFYYLEQEKTGGINVIDLANQHSCAFIATYDLGKLHIDGSFEVLGRFDHSDLRGCNLLIEG